MSTRDNKGWFSDSLSAVYLQHQINAVSKFIRLHVDANGILDRVQSFDTNLLWFGYVYTTVLYENLITGR